VGLCNLGHFVAHELGLHLTRMTCVAGIAMRGSVNKAQLKGLARQLEHILTRTDALG
jgi:hypothetical protein